MNTDKKTDEVRSTVEALSVEDTLKLAEDYANAKATWYVESLYGTSKSYTAEKEREMQIAHTAIRAALASKSEALMSVPDGAAVPEAHKQPAQRTLEEWFKWWRTSTVTDSTAVEIDFSDFMLIVRAVEAVYGIHAAEQLKGDA